MPLIRANNRKSWLARGFCLWLVSLASQVGADESATDWLMRINDAAAKLSFAGTFVYVHDNQIEAMQVARRVRDGSMQERLFALNGEARELVRDMDRVWCYIPDRNIGVHDYRQTSESGFPRILPGDIGSMKVYYEFERGIEQRVADRMATQIKIVPKDHYRYGYSLWADKKTGLLLRSDLLNRDGVIVEQYVFVNIEVDREIADHELESVNSKEQLVWYGTDTPNLTVEVIQKHWQIANLPMGFQLTKHIKRMTPMEMIEEEHMVYTDGLSSFSVFFKKSREGQSGMTGLSRMGAMHAYRSTIGGYWVTVMGEVPAATVKHISRQISYTP